MTNEEFQLEISAALTPIIQRYAEAHRNAPDTTLGFIIGAFAGFAAGIGLGAGLDRAATMTLCNVGAMSGWDAAEKSLRLTPGDKV